MAMVEEKRGWRPTHLVSDGSRARDVCGDHSFRVGGQQAVARRMGIRLQNCRSGYPLGLLGYPLGLLGLLGLSRVSPSGALDPIAGEVNLNKESRLRLLQEMRGLREIYPPRQGLQALWLRPHLE